MVDWTILYPHPKGDLMWKKAAEIKLRILRWVEDPGYEWVKCENKGPGKKEVRR